MEVIVFYLSLILQYSTHNYTVQINKRLQRVTFIWNYFLVLVRNSRLMSWSVISPQRPVWTWSHTWGWVRWGDGALASAETPSPRGLPRSPGLVCHQPFLENRKQNRLPWWSQRQQVLSLFFKIFSINILQIPSAFQQKYTPGYPTLQRKWNVT